MTTALAQPIPTGVEIVVPLTKLKRSPRNARRTPHSTADIEALAASIAVKGVLQPPVVETERASGGEPTGDFLVTIGEGRRLALKLLAQRRIVAKNAPIRCTLDDANDPFEVSLDENVTRAAMHPADQFEAFRDLANSKGWSAEDIATRFGVTAHTVRQRLRLGAVSPKLMLAYRAGELGLEQLMAFALSEDHARQEQVFDNLSFNRSPAHIRRMMTECEVEADDRRAIFVGIEAYQAAGGHVRRDLFAEDRGGWLEDVGLLDRLALDKLQAEADHLVKSGGWRWAEAHLDNPLSHGLRRIYPSAPTLTEGDQTRLSQLADEYDALVAEADDGELPEAVRSRLEAIDTELQAASDPQFTADERESSGVFVVLDWEGALRVERGFVRAEDEQPETERPSQVIDDGGRPDDSVADGGTLKPLSDRLVADLSANRTAALRDALALRPDVALVATVHALVVRTFYYGRSHSCLELDATSASLASHVEGFADTVAAKSIEARHAAWAAKLPKGAEGVWGAVLELTADEQLSLLAYCVSRSVNALRLFGSRSPTLGHDDVLASYLELDMNTYWRPTVSAYFSRVNKGQIVAAVTEAVSSEAASRLSGLKKDAMAQAAAEAVANTGWLPYPLRGTVTVEEQGEASRS